MLRHCEALADLYAQTPPLADDIKHERDLYYIERLRRRALALVIASEAIRRANKGRSNAQREWLISRLCGIWLDNFHADALTVTVPGSGGPPGGPLINFLLAAMRLIMPKRACRPGNAARCDRSRATGPRKRAAIAARLKQRSNVAFDARKII